MRGGGQRLALFLYDAPRILTCPLYFWLAPYYDYKVTCDPPHFRPNPSIISLGQKLNLGVYIVGNCGKQRRPLLHIFGAAFTVSFTSLYVMRIGIARSLLFTAIAATLNGNRHARKVSPGEATFSTKYYMVREQT